MSIFIGIDQSYTGFGLCLLDTEVGHVSYLGKFPVKADPVNADVRRLLAIEDWLSDHLDFQNDIAGVMMEGYAAGAKFGREKAGELGYAVKRTLWELNLKFNVIAPSALKKFVTGKGNAKKNEMLLAVYKRWGVEFKDDNLADAYSMAQAAKALHPESGVELTKYQQEALSTFFN